MILLVDVLGKIGGASLAQIGSIASNVGTVPGLTVISKVVISAHCPALGVKVYVVVPGLAVLTAGDHVPVIPLPDVEGSDGGVALRQSGLI